MFRTISKIEHKCKRKTIALQGNCMLERITEMQSQQRTQSNQKAKISFSTWGFGGAGRQNLNII